MSKALCPLLQLQNIHVAYGKHQVLKGVNLEICEGDIVILVGANGAGKSTLLKSMAGLVPMQKGQITFAGETIIAKPETMLEMGISFVPQDFRVFPEMTVTENILIGAFTLQSKELKARRLAEMYKMFPILQQHAKAKAGTLSGGQKQIVAIARALMLQPKLLLLDEPSVGLAPKIVSDIFTKIKEINTTFNTTIVIVEHNLKTLMRVANQAIILYKGEIAKQDTPQKILDDKTLEQVFFGTLS